MLDYIPYESTAQETCSTAQSLPKSGKSDSEIVYSISILGPGLYSWPASLTIFATMSSQECATAVRIDRNSNEFPGLEILILQRLVMNPALQDVIASPQEIHDVLYSDQGTISLEKIAALEDIYHSFHSGASTSSDIRTMLKYSGDHAIGFRLIEAKDDQGSPFVQFKVLCTSRGNGPYLVTAFGKRMDIFEDETKFGAYEEELLTDSERQRLGITDAEWRAYSGLTFAEDQDEDVA